MPADRQLLMEAEAVCVQAVRQAGAVLLEYFRQPLTVEFKEKGQQSQSPRRTAVPKSCCERR